MPDGTSDLDGEYIVLDEGGIVVPCTDMSIEDLIVAAGGARAVRPASRTSKIAPPIRKLAELLATLHGAQESDQYDFLCRMVMCGLSEVHEALNLRMLAGLAPDGSTVFIVFVKPSISRCLIEANVTG